MLPKNAVTSFDLAVADWRRHECDSENDVCGCRFYFNCTQCGRPQTVDGESMPMYEGNGGKCEACQYGIDARAI